MTILGIQIVDPSPEDVTAKVAVFSCFTLLFIFLVAIDVLSAFAGALFVTYLMSGTICRLYGLTFKANGPRGVVVGALVYAHLICLCFCFMTD